MRGGSGGYCQKKLSKSFHEIEWEKRRRTESDFPFQENASKRGKSYGEKTKNL